jgi:hypothetical protein
MTLRWERGAQRGAVSFIVWIGVENGPNCGEGVGCAAWLGSDEMRAAPPGSVGGWRWHCSVGSRTSAIEDMGPGCQRAKARGEGHAANSAAAGPAGWNGSATGQAKS